MNNILLKNKKWIQDYSAAIGFILGMGLLPYGANASGNHLTYPEEMGMGLLPYGANASGNHLTYLEEMGKRLFFEKISLNKNMSCSSCHTSKTGGTNGDSEINLGQVAVTGSDGVSVGSLKPPTNKYAQFLDDMRNPAGLTNFDRQCGGGFPAPCGGAFWNGRAKGDLIEQEVDVFAGLDSKYSDMYEKYLGPVADQAHASPFINPVEQAKPGKQEVCRQVKNTMWGQQLYQYAWGTNLRCGYKYVDEVFARFAVALAAWQMSSDNNRFDSKRDIALQNDADGLFPLDDFTEQENLGHDLFYNFKGRCAFCHQSGNDQGVGKFERYTNDFYFNIGVPRNHEIPNDPEPNPGLFDTTGDYAHLGEHKVPTLRNVDKRPSPYFTKAYTHNGWFKTLEQLVHFYNTSALPLIPNSGKTRCVDEYITAEQAMAENCWPAPEIDENIATFAVGNLGLSVDEEAALVSYLKTLTDTSSVEPPKLYLPYIYDKRRLEHQDEESSQYEDPLNDLKEHIETSFPRPDFTNPF